MSNNIEFKSKALNVYDYKDVDISSIYVNYEPDPQKIEEELLSLRKKYAENTEVKEVLIGDIVALSCKSENKRFNKASITVNVGKGLFNKEFENNLLGMKKGEEKELVINGDKVWVHIDKISRNVMPELTDEAVAKWNFEGLKSVKELREWIMDSQHEECLKDCAFGAAMYIEEQVFEKSSFALDEGECSRACQEGQKVAGDIMREQGVSPETITKEEAQEMFGSSVEDYIARIENVYKESLLSAILGNKLMKEDLHPLTLEDYEIEVKKRAGNNEADIEEAKQTYTIENYMTERCGSYYFDTIEAYVLKYLKEKGK